MSHDELAKALDMVQHELAEVEQLDPAEVEKLQRTMREIQSALESTDESMSLSERISESARHFEEEHPQMTRTLGRIADMLQQMGI